MKNVMSRAWEIYRGMEGDHRAKLALALRQAWKEAKKESPESIIEKLQAQGLKVTRWTKYGNDRLYVKGFHYSKEYYVDLVKMVAVPNRPGAASDIRNHFATAGITSIAV
jgi:hypothetical protein